MSGVSSEHDQIESNINFHPRAKLVGRKCRVFPANTRIKVPSAPPYRYADLSALCGEPKFEEIGGGGAVTNPALIIESYRIRRKLMTGAINLLITNPSGFGEYLLAAQHRPHVTHFSGRTMAHGPTMSATT